MPSILRHFRPQTLDLGLAALVVLCGSVTALGQGTGTPAEVAAPPESSVRMPVDDRAIITGDSVTDGERLDAARRLLASPSADARATVELCLVGNDAAQPAGVLAARAALVEALTGMSNAPAWLAAPLARLVNEKDLPTAERVRIIAAMGAVRTRDAARILIDLASPAARQPPEVRDAAVAALVRLTGRAEFGADINRWQLWYGQVQWLPEAEWRRELAESLAARADVLGAQRGQAVTRLIDGLRQQYLALEGTPERSRRLIEYMRDTQPEIRSLGLSLAQQEIANARQLDPEVGDATGVLLTEPMIQMRRSAAELINLLAPTRHAAAIAEALRRETEPEIAAVLLKAAARVPSHDLVPIFLNWMDSGPPAAGPACDALDAVYRLNNAESGNGGFRERAVERLRSWLADQPDSLPPSGMRLLYALGESSDRRGVVALLSDPNAARRWAAATAAAQIPDALDQILLAAQGDSALFPLAAQAVAAFRPTAEGFVALASIPAPDAVQRRERLLSLAQALTHAELLRAARATVDANLREAMLSRLLREPLAAQRPNGSVRTLKPEVIAGLLTLCGTRIELGQPAGALVALDALEPAAATIDPAIVNRLRVMILVWLNRLDEAVPLDGPASAWLDGLERATGLEHAANVALMLETRFRASMSASDLSRLRELKSRIVPPSVP